jgi:3D (Asp-Asp-Asp) domain-containing protein
MKSLFGGSAALAVTILAGSVIFYTQPTLAESISLHQSTQQERKQEEKVEAKTVQTEEVASVIESEKKEISSEIVAPVISPAISAAPMESYTATAYAFPGRTASGRLVGKGVIAADPRVLPLGSRVRVEAGNWSGEYVVADTGGAIRGRKIDIWVPTTGEACRFGRRKVKLTVLSYGGRRNKARAAAK